MQSEGPYTKGSEVFYTPENSITLVSEPEIVLANAAHAEGRKSMETDFKEALSWADSICLDWNYSKDYKKWKKARGIE